jgi:hypothetical protein
MISHKIFARWLLLIMHPRMKTDGNGRKIALPFSFSYFFYGNGSGSRTTGNGNGSGINGNAKTNKYDRKIDGNERYVGT